MKKDCFILVIAGLFALITSCSTRYHVETLGTGDSDSSYLITTAGRHVNAANVEVRPGLLTVDKQPYPLAGLEGIRSGKKYFAVADNNIYAAEIYGKINLLYKFSYGGNYTNPNSLSAANIPVGSPPVFIKDYYLQKQGVPHVEKASHATFISYVASNPDALGKARSAYFWQGASYASGGAFLGGFIYTVAAILKNRDNGSAASLGVPLSIIGVSLPAIFLTNSISHHKFRKAVIIYNK